MFLSCLSLLLTLTIVSSTKCNVKSWLQEPQCGDIPPISSQSKMVSFGKDLYLLLGFNECFNVSQCENTYYPFNTIFKFNTNKKQWSKITVASATSPPPRAFFSVDITKTGEILLFGGTSYNNFFTNVIGYNDLWSYSISNNAWTELVPSNPINDTNIPPKNSLNGLVIVKNDVYLFGGITDGTFQDLNTLYKFDLNTNLWSIVTPKPNSPVPSGRGVFGFRRGIKDKNKIYLYGGEQLFGFVTLNDLWVYDLKDNEWTELQSSNGVVPDTRAYGIFIVDGKDNLYVAYGESIDSDNQCFTESVVNSDHSVVDKTWIYDNGKWELAELGTFQVPIKRLAATYNKNKKDIYVVGGVAIYCQVTGGVGVDVYNRNMFVLDVK